eukprot:2913227-Prymnesium_polylepis.1
MASSRTRDCLPFQRLEESESLASGPPETNPRIEALSSFAGVSTFVAGFALADLGQFEYDSFDPPL